LRRPGGIKGTGSDAVETSRAHGYLIDRSSGIHQPTQRWLGGRTLAERADSLWN